MAGRDFSLLFRIGGAISRSFGNSFRDVDRRIQASQDKLDKYGSAAKKSFAVAAAGAFAMGKAVEKSMNFNDDLQLMALTADMSAKQMQSFKKATLDAANASGIMAEKVLEGGSSLIAAGMDAKVAEKMLTTMSRVVVANKAEFEDISAATFSLNEQFGITADRMENAFNILSQGGKEGQFELKAMAQYLPSIGAKMKQMKMDGAKGAASFAAAMQVMRKNAPDDSQAATMMENMLGYAVSPKGLKYAKEMGSDMKKVIEDAWKKGENPMMAYVNEANRITGGDPFKLGQLVRNDEAKAGLQAMIQNLDEYKRVYDSALGAENKGVIDNDYNVMGGTTKGSWDTFKATVGTTAIVIGTVLEPAVKSLSVAVSGWMTKMQAWQEANPVLFGQIIKGAGAAILLVGGLSALAIGVIAIIGPIGIAIKMMIGLGAGVMRLVGFIKYLSSCVPLIITIVKWMASGLWLKAVALVKLLGTTFMWLGRVFLMNPIGLAITAIIAVIALLYFNWDKVSKFLVSSWEVIKSAWSSSLSAVSGFVSSTWASISGFFNSGIANISAAIINWSPLGLFYQAFSAVMNYFGFEMPSKFTEFGKNIIQGLIDGITGMASAAVEKAKAVAASIASAVKGFFGINSPSRLFMEFGEFNMMGLAKGMQSEAGSTAIGARSAVSSAIPSVTPQQASQGLSSVSNSTQLHITQNITVGSQDAYQSAKDGASAGAKDFENSYNAMMRKRQRVAY